MTQSSYEPYVPGRPAPEVDTSREVHRASACGPASYGGPDARILVPSLICMVIWMMTDFGGYFWPMWVMLGTGIPFLLGTLARIDHRNKELRAGRW